MVALSWTREITDRVGTKAAFYEEVKITARVINNGKNKNGNKYSNKSSNKNGRNDRHSRQYERRQNNRNRNKNGNIRNEEEEKERIEQTIENSMNNIIVPIDAEDSDDEMAVNRTPKILEQLKLMKKKKLSDRDFRKSATRKKSKNAKNNNVNRNRKKQIFDPNTGKMQDVDEKSGNVLKKLKFEVM